jgi:hypothetical protein
LGISDLVAELLAAADDQVGTAMDSGLAQLATFWIKKSPDFDDRPIGGAHFVMSILSWPTAVTLVISLLVVAANGAIRRRGEPFRDGFYRIFHVSAVSFFLIGGVKLATAFIREYSSWIIVQSTDGQDIQAYLAAQSQWHRDINANIGFVNDLLMCGSTCISVLIQWVLLMFRDGVLSVLVGLMPIFVAASFTEYGRALCKNAYRWIIVLVIAPGLMATVDAEGFREGAAAHDATSYLRARLIILAGVYVPFAMLRVMQPLVQDVNAPAKGLFDTIVKTAQYAFSGGSGVAKYGAKAAGALSHAPKVDLYKDAPSKVRTAPGGNVESKGNSGPTGNAGPTGNMGPGGNVGSTGNTGPGGNAGPAGTKTSGSNTIPLKVRNSSGGPSGAQSVPTSPSVDDQKSSDSPYSGAPPDPRLLIMQPVDPVMPDPRLRIMRNPPNVSPAPGADPISSPEDSPDHLRD